MTRSDLHKEKHGSKNQLPEDGILDGTSARTRPLSFDDIMLRRRNKGDSTKQISNAHDVADFESAQDNSVTLIELPECCHQMNQDSEPMDKKNNSNYSKKVGSERKGKTRSSRKDDKLVQANDEGSLDPDAKSKKKETKNASGNIVLGGKHERENHGNRKKAGHLSIDSVNGSDKRKDRDSYKKDRLSERCRVKSEIVKNQQQIEEREVYRKRKPDGHSDSDIEYKKRNVKDERKTEKLTSRGREKPEKENRHKRHHEEDHKPRDRITVKKNDTEKKGLETSRTYPEEAGPKRRRSRSREREKDRGRRSRSQSPKAYKHTSKDGRELGESAPSHSTKDRSGREHSDVDKKRTSSNGSGSHYRRNTTSSGLGGYSPRKRKTEAAAKTPSPTRRSPERRNAGWDFQNAEKESSVADSTVSYMNTASQSLLLNVELPSVSPVTTSVVQPIGVTLHTLSSQMHAIEAIQLTQATRPMRRLYVENLPASASEEDLKECINKLLMSTGVNYVHGTQPCISSIIHKEKNQALLEFLTPEDASAALSLDGMSFSGSSLKIRRPKDYAIVTTGLSDKSVGTVDSVSDIVEDSPNKIFIGGISKLYSSKMLLEIAKAFGAVKSFHFEFIADINEPCAFLEYVDHSVTSKACAGLNGMRLGGQVLTAVPATPEPVLVENVGKRPIYVIPEHVKPLLEKPTTVVKLKNVLDPECLLSLAESEVEEILQDIKLECSRFGMVKSVNIAKTTNSFATMEAHEVKNTSASVDVSNFEQLGETSCGAERVDKSEPQEAPNELENNRQTLEDRDGFDNRSGISDLLSGSIEPKEINKFKLVEDSLNDEIIKGNETCGPPMNDYDASAKEQENLSGLAGEFKVQNNVEFVSSIDEELRSEEKSSKIESFADVESDERTKDSDGDKKDPTLADIERVFEAGCVFVEYRREEAACMAAHCLHGRTFDGRIVSVEYVGHDVYQTRFHG